MEKTFQYINLEYLKEICGNDKKSMKELIDIFLMQIPVFILNINKYFNERNSIELAKELHTARSSAMIFMMDETGELLKKIQVLAENGSYEEIPGLIQKLEPGFNGAARELSDYIRHNY